MGATGVGKSALSMTILHSCVKYGFKALLFDTENGEHVTRSRYISRFSGIPYELIERDEMSKGLRTHLDVWTDRNADRLAERLRVVYLGYMSATLADVEAALVAEIAGGYQPDVVVFDSPDHLVLSGKNQQRWEAFTDLYNNLAGIWQRNNVGGWSVTQASGENIETKIATTAHTSDAKGKVRVASIVATINPDIDMKTKKVKEGSNDRILYLAKARNSAARILFPLKCDFPRMRITAPPMEFGET
jgi:hypothetical protein